MVLLLSLYWFLPITTTEFKIRLMESGANFSANYTVPQFYKNMRFPDSKISYKILDCPLQKKDEAIRAFNEISKDTILNFYSINNNEQITVVCDSGTKIEEGLFIAGEGGPTNITRSGDFNVITKGRILLFKESKCPKPNIAIHEVFHVLGFDHVNNPKDIMYPVSDCDQEISESTINTINTIYSVPGYPDLAFEDAKAIMHGRYLNIDLSVRNNGLSKATSSKIKVYADEELIKEIDIDALEIGNGRIISVTNMFVAKISINSISFVIDYKGNELKKENNQIGLEIKK